MVICEKSWNQFCACLKPFTFALMARGLTSCVIMTNSASSTNFSWTFFRIVSCSALSKVLVVSLMVV